MAVITMNGSVKLKRFNACRLYRSNTQTKLRLVLIPAQGCAQGVDVNRKN